MRGVYRHFCMMLMEILHTPRKLRLENWRDSIELVGPRPDDGPPDQRQPPTDRLDRPLRQLGARGLSVWNVRLSHGFGRPHARQSRISSAIFATFANEPASRSSPRPAASTRWSRCSQNNRALTFLADQDAGQRGLFVDFFGQPASTHKAIALLAIEHKAPVAVGVARRIGPGFRYELRCEDVIDPAELAGTADDVRILTQRFTSALERLIRQDPTQYLWLHRRWKHQPQPKRPKVG